MSLLYRLGLRLITWVCVVSLAGCASGPEQGEDVKNALFGAGDVHFLCPEWA